MVPFPAAGPGPPLCGLTPGGGVSVLWHLYPLLEGPSWPYIGLEVLLSIWRLWNAKQGFPGFCYLPDNCDCNANKGQTAWAWVLLIPSVLGTVDIQQLSETSVKKTGPSRKGQEEKFSHGSHELLFAGEDRRLLAILSKHFISQYISSRAHLGLCQEPSLIGVPISRSCQRQANSLRRWLELSQEEPKSEDLHLEEQVKTELEEVRPGQPRASPWLSFLSACLVPPSRPCPQVELQVQQLAKELEAQRQPVGTCIARVRALRRALC